MDLSYDAIVSLCNNTSDQAQELVSLAEKTNQIEGQVAVTAELQTEVEGLKEKQEGAAEQSLGCCLLIGLI